MPKEFPYFASMTPETLVEFCGAELWSNHGPRIGANRYLIRFWEPPASRIFNQLPVNRVLSRRWRLFFDHLTNSIKVFCKRTGTPQKLPKCEGTKG